MFKSFFVLLVSLLASQPLFAQERILDYDSVVEINTDGSLDVTERITVHAEGDQIRRGIYRDFPTRYKDRYGNRVVVDLEVLGLERDGQPEPWFTESKPNGVRINFGNDDFLPTPGTFSYTLHYRTTRQIGFFDDHDELYWNAIGTGWDFPIESGTVEVRLPEAVPVSAMSVTGYSGAQGARGHDFTAALPAPGVARWTLTAPLPPQHGLATVLSFPKGLVTEPTRQQTIIWFLKDNLGVLIALLGLIAQLLFCVLRWRKVGRDPRGGVVIARYQPPEGYSPAALRNMQEMGYDSRCFSSDLLALAVAGHVRIHRDENAASGEWRLEKTGASTEPGHDDDSDAPTTMLKNLFLGDSRMLELKPHNDDLTLAKAQAAHRSVLKERLQPAMFKVHGGSIAFALFLVVLTTGLAIAFSGGAGVLWIIAITVLMVIVMIVFAVLIKAPTRAGRKLLDEIEGLKLYLGVAERDDLARLPGPDAPPTLDAKRYEMLLPYAVALEVEDAWTEQFTLAVGAAAATAATAGIAWYQGSHINSIGSLSEAVGSSLSSQIASSASPPGSSSGGGGFSGGGGGGGGGGGR